MDVQVAEKDELKIDFTTLNENYQKLILDYDTLDKDLQDMFKIEKAFT